VLEVASRAELCVEQVVAAPGVDEVLSVDRAAEPLVAVVEAVVGLDMVIDRAGPDAVQRDHVELVVGAQLLARELDPDEFDHTAAVVRLRSTERHALESFRQALATRAVDGRRTVERETAP